MTPDDLTDALVRATFEVTGVLSRISAENDLSLTQLRVLGILTDRRCRISDLADHLGLDRSTLSGLVDRAERRGLLARERTPHDRRGFDVLATPAGLALAERLRLEIRQALGPMTERLTSQQMTTLSELLALTVSRSDPGR